MRWTRHGRRRAAAAALMVLLATVVTWATMLAAGASPAAAGLYLWPQTTLPGVQISGEQSHLRPRTVDLDGDGLSDLVFTDASCTAFPCPRGSAYRVQHNRAVRAKRDCRPRPPAPGTASVCGPQRVAGANCRVRGVVRWRGGRRSLAGAAGAWPWPAG
jgi:hypothetical protein